MPELTRTTADLPRSGAPVGPAEYQRVIAGVREAVAGAVPPGSIVLVVSRGDEELVRFPNHRGWHFPRAADGKYGGYHPQSGQDAISHLEELRSAGAAFLVLPRTAFWWFDYYAEFAEYLQRNARPFVEDPETCLVFALEGASASAPRVSPARTPVATPATSMVDRLAYLVDALLPEDCSVAIAVGDYERLPALGERGVWRFRLPDPALGLDLATGTELVEQLDALVAAGVTYLVAPREADDLVRLNPTLRYHMETSCRVVTRQRYLGTIYMLSAPEATRQNGNFGERGREERWP
ncbi:MAG: hypothetical protein ACRD21_17395 [Vicinamibacteria bacterium]